MCADEAETGQRCDQCRQHRREQAAGPAGSHEIVSHQISNETIPETTRGMGRPGNEPKTLAESRKREITKTPTPEEFTEKRS